MEDAAFRQIKGARHFTADDGPASVMRVRPGHRGDEHLRIGMERVVEDGVARVREALGEEPERIASALAVALGCERALLLRCADEGTPFLAADRPFPPGTVWNLAFD